MGGVGESGRVASMRDLPGDPCTDVKGLHLGLSRYATRFAATQASLGGTSGGSGLWVAVPAPQHDPTVRRARDQGRAGVTTGGHMRPVRSRPVFGRSSAVDERVRALPSVTPAGRWRSEGE